MRRAAAVGGIWIAALVLAASVVAGDWEHWAGLDMAGPLTDGLTIRIAPEVRSRDDFSTDYEGHFDAGIDWKASKWLSVGPYYRHVAQLKGRSWQVEHRPHLNVTISWNLLGLRLADRSRLEYRIFDEDQAFRYRNRLLVRPPERILRAVAPYLSDEPFYDLDTGEVNKNRLSAGFDFKVSATTRLDVSYLLESRKQADDWKVANIIKTTLKIRPQ
jgi:hypothetical protein